MAPSAASSAFVEPSLGHRYGPDAKSARIVLVSAPGAVGKSTYATQIASQLGLCMLDLARAGPVGEHSFIGGATRAIGANGPELIKNGAIGIIVDALDEAQLKVPPESYQAFLDDVARSTSDDGPPIVLFGRTAAVEDALLFLDDAGVEAAILQIQFFDERQSEKFVERFFSLRSEPSIVRHRDIYAKTATGLVGRLRNAIRGSSDESNAFAGYAPVLEAVCKAIAEEQHPIAAPAVGDAPV